MITDYFESNFPEATAFIEAVWNAEAACETQTAATLPGMGEKAPACFAKLGTLPSRLYRVGCCAWGCRGGDHTVEYIVGRAVTSSLSAVRLMRFGYYDAAIGLVRNITEIANLLYLFDSDATALREWQNLDPIARRRSFSALEVRRRLVAARGGALFDQGQYSLLCEVGTHVSPRTRPQAHNIRNRPTLGAVLQPVGLFLALNELAAAVTAVAAGAFRLRGLPKEAKGRLMTAMRELFATIGGVSLQPMQEDWKTLRAALDGDPEADQITYLTASSGQAFSRSSMRSKGFWALRAAM